MTTEQPKIEPKGVAFRIELRLEPNPEGHRELSQWPATNFTPDFIVATSGSICIELAGQLLGTRDGQVVTVGKGDEQPDVNCWWPDYLGGFALNLGRALQLLGEGAAQTKANLIDEPLLLYFRRQPGHSGILVIFEANGQTVITAEVPEVELRSQVQRALQDFQAQLLRLNPKLANQADVQELNSQIQSLA